MLCLTLPLDTQLAWVWCCLVKMPGVSWGCITNTISLMAYQQQKFISHCSGCWKSQIRVPQGRVLVRTLLWAADSWLLIVSSEASPPNTNYLPKTPPLYTINWGVGFQLWILEGTQAFSVWQWVYSESSQVQVTEIANGQEQGWYSSFKQKGSFEKSFGKFKFYFEILYFKFQICANYLKSI